MYNFVSKRVINMWIVYNFPFLCTYLGISFSAFCTFIHVILSNSHFMRYHNFQLCIYHECLFCSKHSLCIFSYKCKKQEPILGSCFMKHMVMYKPSNVIKRTGIVITMPILKHRPQLIFTPF